MERDADGVVKERTVDRKHVLDGETYAQASRHQRRWGEALVHGLPLTGSERVLDLGCGDGFITHLLASRVPDGLVVGIDKSASMIAKALQLRAPNLSFLLMPMERLVFDTPFDVIFSNAAIHWVRDQAKLLCDLCALLHAGGRLLFHVTGSCPQSVLKRVVTQKAQEAPYQQYFRDEIWPWYEIHTTAYRRLMTETGFIQVDIQQEEVHITFSDADEVVAWLAQPTLVPFLQSMTAQHARGFAAEVSGEVLAGMRQAGRLVECLKRVKVSALRP